MKFCLDVFGDVSSRTSAAIQLINPPRAPHLGQISWNRPPTLMTLLWLNMRYISFWVYLTGSLRPINLLFVYFSFFVIKFDYFISIVWIIHLGKKKCKSLYLEVAYSTSHCSMLSLLDINSCQQPNNLFSDW